MSDNRLVKVIDTTRDGQRIDNFLMAVLKGVPKSLIYRLLRTGKIRVNGKRIKQTYRLQTEDQVSIPALRESNAQNTPAKISSRIKTQIESSLLYEDDAILALNKPAGIAVHPGTNVAYGVIEVLRALRPEAEFLELVHRLDRETSGCLLIAKSKASLNVLHDLFRLHDIEKEYLVLLKGNWNLGKHTVDSAIANKANESKPKKNISRDNKFKQKGNKKTQSEAAKNDHATVGKKAAITHFSPLEIYTEYSLMRVRLATGRTHQIRIHAAELGYPVVGDQKHGNFAFNRSIKRLGLKRMFLHAEKLAFTFPHAGKKYIIKAPLDDELKAFIASLG